MLEDRDYMRDPSGGFRWSATTVILAALVVCFLVQKTVFTSIFVDYRLALSLEGIRHGYLWQLFTFQFLHAGWFHLLMNCWALFMFGREVEAFLGKARFVTLYFLAGVVGGLFQVLVSFLWPHYFGYTHDGFAIPVVGASAGIFGVMAGFAMLFPQQRLSLLLFPISFPARSLLLVEIVIAAIGIAFPKWSQTGNVAHAAHMGGILAGLAYIRWLESARHFWRWRPFQSRHRKRELVKAASIRTTRWPASKPDAAGDLPEEEFISREVDPILDKISKHGIQSLTERERRVLEAARNRMAKR